MMPLVPEQSACNIKDVLEAPLCLQITRFFLQHQSAMDTAEGIAAWWVHCDPMAARAALDSLIRAGVVECHTFSTGTMYRLTRDPSFRAWLVERCSLQEKTDVH
jgi:hypothetical protein